MPLPTWTIELIRRSLNEVAEKAQQPEAFEKIKTQATELLGDLPATAARGIDAVMRGAEASRQSVQRWARKHVEVATPMLNASGTLITPWGMGVGIDKNVASLGRELIAGDALGGEILDERLQNRLGQLAGKIHSPGGKLSIAVAASFDGAIASLAAFSASHTLVVHRSDAVRLPSGKTLPELLSAIGVPVAGLRPTVMEVGAVDHRAASDFEGIQKACLVTTQTGSKPFCIEDLEGPETIQVVVLPLASLKPCGGMSHPIPCAESALSEGADLVVVPGDGLLGGPASGLIIGNSGLVETIERCSAWSVLSAGLATTGMVVAAIETDLSPMQPSPIGALIQVNPENLRSRCQRLAVRLNALDCVASCEVTDDDAFIDPAAEWPIPSRQLRLKHRSKSSEHWAEQLREESPALIGGFCDQFVKIDLRWIDASTDSMIAEQIETVG